MAIDKIDLAANGLATIMALISFKTIGGIIARLLGLGAIFGAPVGVAITLLVAIAFAIVLLAGGVPIPTPGSDQIGAFFTLATIGSVAIAVGGPLSLIAGFSLFIMLLMMGRLLAFDLCLNNI